MKLLTPLDIFPSLLQLSSQHYRFCFSKSLYVSFSHGLHSKLRLEHANFPQMAPVTESPMSTLSFQGTPNTIYTESVEDSRCDTATTVETPARRQDACDPFYSIQRVQGQREPTRMSAMAPPFRPRGLNFYPIPQHQIASAPVTQQPLPGTTEYLLDQIQSQTDSETPFGITSFGEFTNTTVRQRCMKITAMNGGNTLDLVDRALIVSSTPYRRPPNCDTDPTKPLALQGSRRVASAGTAVLLRLGNIYDAALVYSALQGTGELAIEFVSPVVFQIVSAPKMAQIIDTYTNRLSRQRMHLGLLLTRVKFSYVLHMLRILCWIRTFLQSRSSTF